MEKPARPTPTEANCALCNRPILTRYPDHPICPTCHEAMQATEDKEDTR